jgi:hypothetical protein
MHFHNLFLQKSFFNNMRDIPNMIALFSSLSPRAQRQLELLRGAGNISVQWGDFTSLSLESGLFDSSFVGLDTLSGKLQRLVSI